MIFFLYLTLFYGGLYLISTNFSILSEKGTHVYIENEEVYTYKVRFRTDETMTDFSIELPPEETDFSSIDKETLWAYIFGEYIMNGRLKNIDGFGITKTETY